MTCSGDNCFLLYSTGYDPYLKKVVTCIGDNCFLLYSPGYDPYLKKVVTDVLVITVSYCILQVMTPI